MRILMFLQLSSDEGIPELAQYHTLSRKAASTWVIC